MFKYGTLLVISLGCLYILSLIMKPEARAEQTLNQYMGYLQGANYHDACKLMTDDAKAKAAKDAKREGKKPKCAVAKKDEAKQGTIPPPNEGDEVKIEKVDEKGDTASIEYRIEPEDGSAAYSGEATLEKEDGEWRVEEVE